MQHIKVPGQPAIAIDRDGQGEVLLLLHGIGGNRTNWHEQVAHFAARFNVVSVDVRGWEDSDDYEGPLDFDDVVDDMARVLNHLGESRCHLVGLPMGGLDGLGQVLDQADIVVVAIELNHATQGLIGRAELQRMRPDAILVNMSRAAVVQQDALYEHLQSHPQFRAGLDVWWQEPMHGGAFEVAHPFFSLPNLIGSPHNSPMVPGIMTDLIEAASANIARFLRGEPVQHLATSAM